MRDSSQTDVDSLVDSSPQRNSGISWPRAVDLRLDQILDRARRHGERTTRKELVAAIVCAFDASNAEFIERALKAYRRATVAEVLLDPLQVELDGVIKFPDNKPGPRSREAGAGHDTA